MTVHWAQVIIAGVWGGLCALERRAFLQAMFSRPLVAATGMGMLLDDLPAGLYVGMVLELYFLGAASLGAAKPANDTLAATCASAAAACLATNNGADSTPAIWSLCILGFVLMGDVGRFLDRRLERHSTNLAGKALASADAGNLNRAVRQNLWGMWPHFLVFGGLTALCALIGFLAAPFERMLPRDLLRGFAWAYPAIASVAAAIAVRGSHARRGGLFAGIAAAVVAVGSVLGLRMEGGQ